MDPRGRTALVTGGAVRVGRAISLALADAGARVVVHHHASAKEAKRLVESIRADGREAAAISADLRTMDGVRSLAKDAPGLLGPIDILVNNASVFPPADFAEVDEEIWERTIAVNLRAPFFLSQQLGLQMKSRGVGVIVNMGDLAGIQTWKGYAAHSISKAGLLHLTRVSARALAPEVRVAAIAPGTILPPEGMTDREVQALAKQTPLEHIGSPQDVVDALLYIVQSYFVTGEVMVVDGGRLLA